MNNGKTMDKKVNFRGGGVLTPPPFNLLIIIPKDYLCFEQTFQQIIIHQPPKPTALVMSGSAMPGSNSSKETAP